MRLLRRIERVEQAEQAERAAGSSWSLVWTGDDDRLRDLPAGQEAAADVTVEALEGGAALWSVRERLSSGPGDLGVVLDERGRPIGRVVSLAGELITVVYHEHAAALPLSVPRPSHGH